jgi:RNA polymerase sigma factor (sigma-70 family)
MNPSLFERIARGDPGAMGQCIDEFGTLVWGLARRLSRTTADAEDAVQDIFTDLWRSANRYDASQGSEKMFVAMIARRRLIDRLRRHKSEPLTVSDEALMATAEAAGTDSSEVSAEAETAARALSQLRPEQRQVLEMSLLEGLSQTEIASRLNLPLGTVKTFMRRGLIKVRESLNLSGDLLSQGAPA